MTFNCLDCNQPIEDEPWWFDPLAHGMNRDAQVRPHTPFVSQRHQRPHQHHFHKACLDRQWAGVSIPGYQQRAKSRQGQEVRLSDYFARGQGKRFTALSVS